MKPMGIALAIALLLSGGTASAQAYDDRYGPAPYGDYSDRTPGDRYDAYDADRLRDPGSSGAGDRYADDGYDWARVVRVDPVFDGHARTANAQRECRTRRDGYVTTDPYRTDSYRDGYYGDGDRRDGGYPDPYGQSRRDANGRMVATVIGGIAGAVLGSKVGSGSGSYIGTAVGSMVGGMAGRGIYDANRRQRDAYVTVCEPDPYRGDTYDTYGRDAYDRAVDRYDVTYEYAGRQYTTRTSYHPGDRIRVRVDVRPE